MDNFAIAGFPALSITPQPRSLSYVSLYDKRSADSEATDKPTKESDETAEESEQDNGEDDPNFTF